jgi:hypothetical protein
MFEFQRVVDEVLNAPPERKAWLYAHVLVPAIVVAVLLGVVTVPGFADGDSSFAIIPLQSVYQVSRTSTVRAGVALIFEPDDAIVSIPWRYASAPEIWTSIDTATHAANAERLRIDGNRIAAELPLLGASDPVLVIAEGVSAGDIMVRRDVTPFASARLHPRQSAALATWAMVITLFGAALTSVSTVSRALPTEDRAGHERT